ncbi:hypothetical protein Aab01nite_53610 [Paractinoplanes abujensis]|nr:hypothetical protein Aab01nite_53610 [Actinoplanes abujensis]
MSAEPATTSANGPATVCGAAPGATIGVPAGGAIGVPAGGMVMVMPRRARALMWSGSGGADTMRTAAGLIRRTIAGTGGRPAAMRALLTSVSLLAFSMSSRMVFVGMRRLNTTICLPYLFTARTYAFSWFFALFDSLSASLLS